MVDEGKVVYTLGSERLTSNVSLEDVFYRDRTSTVERSPLWKGEKERKATLLLDIYMSSLSGIGGKLAAPKRVDDSRGSNVND